MSPRPDYPEPHVRITATPGIGELFFMPGYTNTGPCDIILWEAVPQGPFDVWSDRPSPDGHLARTLELMRQYAPWEYERAADVEPTDARCTLYGGYAPVVRHPVGRLSGSVNVLGMGDVLVANDPVTGQGSDNAARCAAIYCDEIIRHGDRPFDAEWMQRTFEVFWDYARHPTTYTNMMLGPLPEHVQKVLGAAAQNEAVAHRSPTGTPIPTTSRTG